MSDKIIEWAGASLGLLGSWMVAMNSDISKYSFVGFLLSNIFWVVFAIKKKAWGLLTMQIGFTGSSLLGLYTYFNA